MTKTGAICILLALPCLLAAAPALGAGAEIGHVAFKIGGPALGAGAEIGHVAFKIGDSAPSSSKSRSSPSTTLAPSLSKSPSLLQAGSSSRAPTPSPLPSSAAPNPFSPSSPKPLGLAPVNGVQIQCAESITIAINPYQLSPTAKRLHLSAITAPYCSALKMHGVFNFRFGLSDCGTTVSSTEDYIVYENSIRVDNNLTIGEIQRQHEKGVIFRCRYNRKTKLNNVEFSGSITTIQYTSERFGKFDLFIGLFKQDTLSTAVQPNDAIDVLKTIYARLKLESSSGSLKMAVQSCIATPHNTPPDNATYTHDLINSRCLADSTVSLLETSDPKEFRFKFQSFVFAKLGDTVFIHCTVVVCKTDESTKTCSNPSAPCSKLRRRSSGIDGAGYTEYAITHGPFKQIKVKRSLQVSTMTKEPAVKNWRAITAAVSGGLFVTLVVTIVARLRKSRQVHRYKALTLNPFTSME